MKYNLKLKLKLNRLPNKSSGTGIALYVHDSFSVKVLDDACATHPHIETIFAQVKKGNTTLNVGLLYLKILLENLKKLSNYSQKSDFFNG